MVWHVNSWMPFESLHVNVCPLQHHLQHVHKERHQTLFPFKDDYLLIYYYYF